MICFHPQNVSWWCCCCVHSLSHVQLFETPWTIAHSLSLTTSQSSSTFMSIKSVMPSHHLILCCPLLLLPSIFPRIRGFPMSKALPIRWPKYWSFSFSISPSNEYSGLISFRIDWFDHLAVQGTQESSPAPQLGTISSLVLSLPCGPILLSVHDYWRNHRFD